MTGVLNFDHFDLLRTSEVSTCPRQLASASTQVTSGSIAVAKAYARTAGTFTKIRFATGGAGAGCTDLRAGVFNQSLAVISQTADQSASFAQNTLFDNVALGTSVIMAAGDWLWLGVGSVASTSIQFRCGAASSAAIMNLSPGLCLSKAAGLTAGSVLVDITGAGNTSALPWVELIP